MLPYMNTPATLSESSARQDFNALAAVVDERRRTKRVPYRCRQRIGYFVKGATPMEADFAPVECNDLSAGGLSYWSDELPPSNDLVIELGHESPYVMLIAEVRHCSAVNRNGRTQFLIGCEFTGRL